MNIGKLVPQANGNIQGVVNGAGRDLEYSGLTLQFWLEPVIGKTNPNAPDFDVFSKSRFHGEELRVGAAWEKRTQEGEAFLQITFDDRSLPKKIYVNCYADKDHPSNYVIPDSRIREQKAA